MFGSTVIDVAIGLVFVYLLLSLICSAVNEIIERFAKYRASDLERGVRELLQDQAWVAKIYTHPMVNGLFEGAYTSGGKNLPSYIPATNFALALMDCVLPNHGASGAMRGAPTKASNVIVNVAAVNPPAADEDALQPLRDAILKMSNAEMQRALMTLVGAAGKDAAKARENIETWFNSGMDRVSGWYKRRSQLIILISGLVLAAFMNADTIAIVRGLSTDRSLRDSLVVAAQEYARSQPAPSPSPAASLVTTAKATASPTATPKQPGQTTAGRTTPAPTPSAAAVSTSPQTTPPAPMATASPAESAKESPCDGGANNSPECRIEANLNEIKKLGLPIGWTQSPADENDPRSLYIHAQRWPVRIVGWLLTAFAVSLGAPFWFDMLNKFVVVRSTVKPHEKSREESSKD